MPVYFAKIDGDPPDAPVKIGYAVDLAQRLMTLQCGHYRDYYFIRAVEGDSTEETRIHRLFHQFRIRGEWFRFDPAMFGPVGAADIPFPSPIIPTLRGGPMPEAHRAAIAKGVRRSWAASGSIRSTTTLQASVAASANASGVAA